MAQEPEAPEPHRLEDYTQKKKALRDASANYRDASQHRIPVALKPVLIIYHRGSKDESSFDKLEAISRIEYVGDASRRDWLSRLLIDPALAVDFKMELSLGEHRCRFWAEPRVTTSKSVVHALVSRMLSVLLVAGRPLRYYTCTFLLPLDLKLDDEFERDDKLKRLPKPLHHKGEVELHAVSPNPALLLKQAIGERAGPRETDIPLSESECEAQAMIYLVPPIQRFVFDTGQDGAINLKTRSIDPVKHWRLLPEEARKLTLKLTGISVDEERVAPLSERRAQVDDLSLFEYYNGLYLLALRVTLRECVVKQARTLGLFQDGPRWWHSLFAGSEAEFRVIQGLQAEAWLHFTRSARLLRPAFPEEVEEGKLNEIVLGEAGAELCAFNYEHDFSPVVKHLLGRFVPAHIINDEKRFKQVRDDRMFVNVAYGLAGPAPAGDVDAEAAFERLFSFALNGDRATDSIAGPTSFAYDRAFVQAQLEREAYSRWKEAGVLSGYTYWSNVYMGFNRYFAEIVASVHVPYIYQRMLMLALFYQASLYHYERGVTRATQELIEIKDSFDLKNKTEAFRNLRGEFIEFTNKYWLREVTAQTQGSEIFQLQTKALALDDKYALIKDEMERADEYVEAQRQRWFSTMANRIAIAALIVAVIAIFLSIFGIGTDLCWTGLTRWIVSLMVPIVLGTILWFFVQPHYLKVCYRGIQQWLQLNRKAQSKKARLTLSLFLIVIFLVYLGMGGYLTKAWNFVKGFIA